MGFIKTRLSLMMFLQYAVWGFWLPVLATYLQAPVDGGGLGFTPAQVGWILGLASSIGAISAPFVAGQIADRYFSAERFLAFLLIAGGIIKFYTAFQTGYVPWLFLSIIYSVLYVPTLALTNSLAFSHLKDADREFSHVRVWGTIGWIAASWIFPMVWLQTNLQFQAMPPFLAGEEMADSTNRLVDALKFSGVTSVIYGLFCFALPHTPPQNKGQKLAVSKAFSLILQKRSFLVLVVASLPISIIHNIYFMQTGPFFKEVLELRDSDIGPAMTIGQFAEIAVLAALGLMLTRLGFRITIAIGCAAYLIRYAIFGSADFLPTSVVVSSQALHGFCYACFFAAAFIYVDRIATADMRHSVQTVFGIVILGVGPVISAPILGYLASIFTTDGVLNYSALWYTLSAMGLATIVFFFAFFRDESKGEPKVEPVLEETMAG